MLSLAGTGTDMDIDDLLNFSCEEVEGDQVGGQSLEDICRGKDFAPDEDTADLKWLSTLLEDSDTVQTPSPGIDVPATSHAKCPCTPTFVHQEMIPPTTVKCLKPTATELKKRKRKKLSATPGSMKQSPPRKTRRVQKCLHCDTRETPRWIVGPSGKNLCNVCGLQYNLGQLFTEYLSAANPAVTTPSDSNSQPVVSFSTPTSSSIDLLSPFLSELSSKLAELESTLKAPEIAAARTKKKKKVQSSPIPGLIDQSASQQNTPVRRSPRFDMCKTTQPSHSKSLTVIPLMSPASSSTDKMTQFPSSELSSKLEKLVDCRIELEVVPELVTAESKKKNDKLSPKPGRGRKSASRQSMPVWKCSHSEKSKSLQPSDSNSQPAVPLMSPTSSLTAQVPPFTSLVSSSKLETSAECQTILKEKVKLSPEPGSTEQSVSEKSRPVRKCLHCETTETPQWRLGPLGPMTLCNACGVRYKAGRLFPEYRPAASPTFVATCHSNYNRKVVQLRTKSGQCNLAQHSTDHLSAASPTCITQSESKLQPLNTVMSPTSSSTGPNPPFSSSDIYSNLVESLQVPKPLVAEAKNDKMKLSPLPASQPTTPVQKCSPCEISKIARQRKDPLVPVACGVKCQKEREPSPAASQVSVETLYSDSDEKVLELKTDTDQDLTRFWLNYI